MFISFNSTLVQLKALYNFKSRCISSQFQFYLSSIKRTDIANLYIAVVSFNSTLVQLKDAIIPYRCRLSISFNSTLVQLKENFRR